MEALLLAEEQGTLNFIPLPSDMTEITADSSGTCIYSEYSSPVTRGADADPRLLPYLKYWDQRYRLFSLFDYGVCIADYESWFSVRGGKGGKTAKSNIVEIYLKMYRLLTSLDRGQGSGEWTGEVAPFIVFYDVIPMSSPRIPSLSARGLCVCARVPCPRSHLKS